MRTRVYISGPISRGDLAHNIKQAEDAFFQLLKAGYAPSCPMWSAYSTGPIKTEDGKVFAHATQNGGGGCSHTDWLGIDLSWVAVSQAILRLPGDSRGADMEVALAHRLGIPIYHTLEHLLQEMPAATPHDHSPAILEVLHG